MIYYRFAFKGNRSQSWQWHSTYLTSFNALFRYLRICGDTIPQDHFRIFFSSSKDAMETMRIRQNAGLVSCSLTVEQLLTEKSITFLEVKRLELELSMRGDHDLPYLFTSPSIQHLLAWTKLKAKVQNGEVVL
jgi:hypothetical protein